MKILFLTMEYHVHFSGNGTASQSFVRGLQQLGEEVMVVCAVPQDWAEPAEESNVVCTPVSRWRVHGRNSPWAEWSSGLQAALKNQTVRRRIESFAPSVVVGVDWEANEVYQSLQPLLQPETPYVYYNYRVYHKNTGNTEADTAFYIAQETLAASMAKKRIVCLCRTDERSLRDLIKDCAPRVLLPGLRDEMRQEAGRVGHGGKRRYLLCCVRVVKEKNAYAFVNIVRGCAEALAEHGLVPYLAGAAAEGDGGYADTVREWLANAYSGAIVRDFLPPSELAAVMAQSVVNVHPALNEAYGMTIVESAAMGCPSVVHSTDIGATDLLCPDAGEVFTADMTRPGEAAALLCRLLSSAGADSLRSTAARARDKALSYGEVENAAALRDYLKTCV